MKNKITLTIIAVLMTALTFAQGLFISEVTDPKDTGNAKFVELYNATDSDIDLEAGNYYLSRQANGGTSWGDIQLTGTIAAGATYVIAYNQSAFSSSYGFDADLYNGYISGNGNDGYFLYQGGNHEGGTLVDAYGVIDEDGTGKDWEYKDGRAVRTYGIDAPNPTWTASEWVVTRPANVADMTPGVHSVTPPEGPQITGVAIVPQKPTSSDEVTVSATVTDNGSVDTVNLYYSTSSPVSTSDTQVNMTVENGDVYTAIIPQQANETTIYYIIVAVDNEGNETQSEEFSYTVEDPLVLSIAEIQTPTDISQSDASPYEDEYVSVTGIVSAVSTTNNPHGYFIQDAEGAWNGIFVKDYDNTASIGDEVTVSGYVTEYKEFTEIVDVVNFSVNSTGNTPYPATVVTTEDANKEDYEGVLLTVTGKCVAEPNNYNEWQVQDDSAEAIYIDDMLFEYAPTLNAEYTVTGPRMTYYSNKILPRDANDIIETLPEGPVVADVVSTPESPTSSDRVKVSANITDDSSVASATLYYSTSTPVTTTDTSVDMSVDSGDTYVAEIPEQADGTTVYYMIVAVDDEGNVTQSVEFSYTVSNPLELSIHDIQYSTDEANDYPSPYLDAKVSVSGIVYATTDSGYFIQDGEGAWNGIYVHDDINKPTIGDEVKVIGIVVEFYNLTEVDNLTSYEIINTGNTPYAETEVSTNDANNEEYEGVLLKVSGECKSDPDTHGEWQLDDGSGVVIIDDLMFPYTPEIGKEYDVTGAGFYSYGNRKITPRDDNDVQEKSTDAVNQMDDRFALYPSPVTNVLNIESPVRISNVSIVDILGKVVKTYQVDAKTAQLNTVALNQGVYIIKLTADNGEVYTQKIIKK